MHPGRTIPKLLLSPADSATPAMNTPSTPSLSAQPAASVTCALLADAPVAWNSLLSRIEDAVWSEYAETVPGLEAARNSLSLAFSSVDQTEAHWLTYRLLWAITWPSNAVPAEAVAARALGAIFDSTVLSRHASRPLADTWISWAARWTKSFGAEWTALLSQQEARLGAGPDHRHDAPAAGNHDAAGSASCVPYPPRPLFRSPQGCHCRWQCQKGAQSLTN